jgi:penicillin-binding protein 1C
VKFFAKYLAYALGGIAIVALGLAICRASAEPLDRWFTSSRAVYDREGKLLRLTLSDDQKYRVWYPLAGISSSLVEAALLKEDHGFFMHPGINPFALVRAAVSTYIIRSHRIGGSTITMQVARMLYGIRSKSLSAKVYQIARALELELFHSKREILEAYLNLVPMGANVEGVGAASLIYFHKNPLRLSLPESLTLVEIPQSPTARGLNRVKSAKVPPLAVERWLEKHPESDSLRRDATLSVQAFALGDLPFFAPHFTDEVLRRKPNEREVTTTLDLSLQSLVERRMKSELTTLATRGVHNAAAMIVDSRTMEVRAMVGSANYFDPAIAGQVNGATAKRSPGSTLKPFVYGLALDRGLIHELSMLKDAPTSFGSFDPENFDRDFAGPISAKDALIRSRNIPAVALYSQLDSPNGNGLYRLLTDAGISRMRGEKIYGYALPLGGSELTMEELVGLYGALANGGDHAPVRYFARDPKVKSEPKKSLMSPEAAYIVYDMLTANPRPDQTYRNAWIRDPVPVAWKTGTSHAFRDAWSIGLFGPYVLAVWVGNFDGSSNPNLVGRDVAAPIFFGIVDAMKAVDGSRKGEGVLKSFMPPLPPTTVSHVKVCSRSGHLPGRYCHDQVDALYIPGKSPIKVCDVHRLFRIDVRSGRRVCESGGALASASSRTRDEVFEVWPSDILRLFKRAGLGRRTPPPYEAGCAFGERLATGRPPAIASPKTEMTYLFRYANADSDTTLPLNAVADGEVRTLYWLMNDEYLGKSDRDSPLLWKMRPGSFQVRAVDDQGRTDSRAFHVEVVQ